MSSTSWELTVTVCDCLAQIHQSDVFEQSGHDHIRGVIVSDCNGEKSLKSVCGVRKPHMSQNKLAVFWFTGHMWASVFGNRTIRIERLNTEKVIKMKKNSAVY